MRYEEWLAQVPESLKKDPLWKFEAYPKALLLFDLAWEDSEKLMRDVRGRAVARQLIRSAGSVSANIDEGFGRGVDRGEYVQFLRYALGSARDSLPDTSEKCHSEERSDEESRSRGAKQRFFAPFGRSE